VDDGSNDKTAQVLKAYAKKIRYIYQQNQGVSEARNVGIKVAKGEWIAFLDSDDLWMPEKLEIQVKGIQQYRDVVAHMVDGMIEVPVGGYVSTFEMRGLQKEFFEGPLRTRPLLDVIAAQFWTSAWLIRRTAMESTGNFDPGMRIYEDLNLLVRVALEGKFVVSCYRGVKIRRRPGNSPPLSDLHVTSKADSFKNLIKTYDVLKTERRLTDRERALVRRMLSGVRQEMAIQQMAERAWREAMKSTCNSVLDDFGPRSITRAILSWIGVYDVLQRCLSKHKKKVQFRRSELDKSAQAKSISCN
jgi:glycosyltransferase involved in cell wall biosynthesis